MNGGAGTAQNASWEVVKIGNFLFPLEATSFRGCVVHQIVFIWAT